MAFAWIQTQSRDDEDPIGSSTTDFTEQMSQGKRLVCGHTDFRLASSEAHYCRLVILSSVTKGFPPDFDSNSEEASDALSD